MYTVHSCILWRIWLPPMYITYVVLIMVIPHVYDYVVPMVILHMYDSLPLYPITYISLYLPTYISYVVSYGYPSPHVYS